MEGAEILRSEAYLDIVATTKDENNAADGLFAEPSRNLGGMPLMDTVEQLIQEGRDTRRFTPG
jgi:hypothetical protein